MFDMSRGAKSSKIELGWERKQFSESDQTQLVARTRGDQIVCFNAERSLIGQILEVEITAARGMTLFARLATAAAC